jgi:hypothetical protein
MIAIQALCKTDIIRKSHLLDESWYVHSVYISTNFSFGYKDPGVPDDSEGFDGTSCTLTENYSLPVAPATGHIAYIPHVPCARNVVTFTHHQNDTCITLFTWAAVMLQPLTQCLAMFLLSSQCLQLFQTARTVLG